MAITQTGGSFIQVILYRISTTGARSSDHNKEVAAINQRCDTTQQETFEGENFREFQGFVAICGRFLHKIWGRGIFCESFLFKNLFSTNSRKFSPTKVSCYTVVKQLAKSQNMYP